MNKLHNLTYKSASIQPPEHRLTTTSRDRARATNKAAVVMGDTRDPLEMPAIYRALSTCRATCSLPAYLLVRQCPALHMTYLTGRIITCIEITLVRAINQFTIENQFCDCEIYRADPPAIFQPHNG